ncbi:MFS transporter [Bacillus tianshenii]|uniref:MFS transporter n=1 Tax=Sutcliffiella tianshenii TaxID=1463404 RepID=UPI001CD3E910|nr:MFS transporter [Bacillus tianshenii]MCA1319122.1 MFS transporter [Bacillus tianshenii]
MDSTNTRAIEEPVLQESKVIIFWSITVWLVVMNTTMFNVALPSVLRELSLSSSTASWIVSGYSIVFAIATLTYSRLSDFIPIKRLLTIGLSLLAISSIIGFISSNFYMLLAARLLQAGGAGAVPGLAMVLAGRYIPISRRGKAMAFISSAASLGFGLGPVIGGLITQYLGWHYLFMVTGFVLLLLPVFRRLLPYEEVQKGKFDLLGSILIGLGVTGLLLYLSSFSLPILIGSILILGWLWWHIHRIPMPFIQPALLKNRQFTKLLFIGFGAFVTHFSSLFLMPIMLSVLFEKEPATIGLLIFPGAILSAIAAQFIGRLIDRFGNMPLILFGEGFLIVATVSFAFFGGLSEYAILFTYMFMSTGFSALTSSISNEISRILDKKQLGAGMGIAQLVQFFGGAFGVALTGLLLVWQSGISVDAAYRNIFIGLTVLLSATLAVFWHYRKNKGI